MICTERRGIFLATIFSTVSLIIVIVVLPLIHVNNQRKITFILYNVEFCKLENRDALRQFSYDKFLKRKARDGEHSTSYGASYGAKGGAVNSCCACTQGATGNRGSPGVDGKPGKPGAPGSDGEQGRRGAYLAAPPPENIACQKCPPGVSGAPGISGVKGPRGFDGLTGKSGKAGEHNRVGPPGPPGIRGDTGLQGPKGPNGDRGKVLNGAPPGPSGPTGRMGARGQPGGRGHDGKVGLPGPIGIRGPIGERGSFGNPGLPGPQGPNGESGYPGPCNHCSGYIGPMYPAPPKPPARQPVSHSDIVAASYSGDGGNKISPENIEPMESSKRKHSTNSSSFSQHDERPPVEASFLGDGGKQDTVEETTVNVSEHESQSHIEVSRDDGNALEDIEQRPIIENNEGRNRNKEYLWID